ncbi:hypothetical protein BGZ75_003514 [Mortierella antarctica]|nr:hypothetical protein BGZ75_003514 [Mortierella antarctica]
MEETQSLRLVGSTDIEEITCYRVGEQDVVYWEDIEQVFPGVKHVKNGKVTVSMVRDSQGVRITPHCIKHCSRVLDVVLHSDVDRASLACSMATASLDAITRGDDPSFSHPPDAPADIPLTNALDDTLVDAPPAKPPSDGLAHAPPNNVPVYAPNNVPVDAPNNVPVDAPINAPEDEAADAPAANVAADDLAGAPSNNASTFASANVLGDTHPNTLANDPADTSANDPAETPTTAIPNHSPIPTPSKLPTNNQSNPSPPAEIPDVLQANPVSSLSISEYTRDSTMTLAEPVSALAIAAVPSAELLPAEPAQQFQNTVIRKLDGFRDQGAQTQQLAHEILKLQKQMNDRLILIQSKTEAILNQQLELAEYPIPRLFIVLPEELTKYDPSNWFRNKFRLHFICECGKHTEPKDCKVPHHLHLAKHEGYLIREPTEFFKKYGPFLLLMLELIKFGTSVAGHVVPTLASLKVVELVDSVK